MLGIRPFLTTLLCSLACLGAACTDDGASEDEATGSTSESSSGSESDSSGSSESAGESAGETSAGETSAGETSAGETSAGETSAGETSAGETSAGETSGGFGSCAEIEAAYESEVSLAQCSVDEDCKIVLGHCGVGLGGCDYAVNVEVSETLLDQLADAYVAANCTQGVCDCAPPPAMAVCVEGTCMGQG
jgi:hypothetical protein